MANIRVKSNMLPEVIARQVQQKLASRTVASILEATAKKRIMKGGDSEVTYPELWATREQIGTRKNGTPLRGSTGHLMSLLHSKAESSGERGVTWTLLDGSGYGVKHQEGFINEGPVAVPLTKKAERLIPSESPHDIAYLDSLGLEEAPNADAARNPKSGSVKYDYYIIEDGGKVPARPIANMPPEDVEAITAHITRTIKELTWH